MSMGPKDVADYVEKLRAEFDKNPYLSGSQALELIKVALHEKMRYEAGKTGGLRDR